MEKEMKRIAIYARVSTEEQAEHGYSIDAQLDTLRQYSKRMGNCVVDEYVDRGVSGKEFTKRLELQRLLADAQKGKFDEVLVWKINRMSRKAKDLMEIVERLNRNNIEFISFSENFDTKGAIGKFALQMMGAVGELERNTIVENVKLGLKQRARMGYHNGGNALGYESVELAGGSRKNKKTELVIYEDEAIIVRKIFEAYVGGRGFRSIANQLNKEGYRTKRGNNFASCAIKEIVTNPLYTGLVRYNRFEGWSEKRRKGKSDNVIIVEGRHEAIIDRKTWETAQEIFGKKSKLTPRAYDSGNVLSSLIRCPQCGAPMVIARTINRNKNGEKIARRYYSCSVFKNKGSSVCSANSVNADYAEAEVIKRVRKIIGNQKLLRDVVAAVNEKRSGGKSRIQKEMKAAENSLAELMERKQRVLDIYEMDGIDRDTVRERLDYFAQEEAVLNERKRNLLAELECETGRPIESNELKALLERLDGVLSQAPHEQVKLLLQSVIKEIHVKKKGVLGEIVFAFDLPNNPQENTEKAPSVAQATDGAYFLQPRNGLRLLVAI